MTHYSFEYDRSYTPPAPVVDIVIDGYNKQFEPISVRALVVVDSGADGTMVPKRVLERLHARRVSSEYPIFVRGVTGIRAAAIGNECIIGRDLLNRLIVELNGLSLDAAVSDGE